MYGAHVNFLNLFNDDLNDTGIAGVGIYKFDADGKAIEHWDALQFVGDSKNAAPLIAQHCARQPERHVLSRRDL